MIVRTDRLGDVVLTLPLLPILRQQFPRAFLAMLVGRYAGGIVEGNPSVNDILWYDDDGGLPVAFGAMLRTLRLMRFDACVVVHPTARLALLMFLAGIPVRVGSGYRWYSLLFSQRVFTHRKTAERHELEYNIELLARLGCPIPEEIKPEFAITIGKDSSDHVAGLLAKRGIAPGEHYAVIHPGSGGSSREWPQERLGDLARVLLRDHVKYVVVTGTAREADRVAAVVRHAGKNAVGMAGELSLKDLAALISRSDLFVSNSTGPLHVAVAVGAPVVCFYPQLPVMGPRRWGPYTKNARVLVPRMPVDCSACEGKKGPCSCMASISVEEAAAAAADLLASQNPTTRRTSYAS